MKYLISIAILFSSCCTLQRTEFYETKNLVPPIVLKDKSKDLFTYSFVLEDSVGLYYIKGNTIGIRFIYNSYNIDDTLNCTKQMFLFNKHKSFK